MTGIQSPKIALITCKELPEPDFDEELLVRALGGAGVTVDLLPWDDSDANVEGYSLAILRSCWNYYEEPQRFLEWIERASRAAPLANGADLIRWNIHKHYLRDLERDGLPIVPTVWFEKGVAVDLRAEMDRLGWSDVVVKPAISAGSFQTKRFRNHEADEGEAFLRSNLGIRDMMVQRYMSATEESGEKALIWIDGEFTHAVRKEPRFTDGVEKVSEALSLTEQEHAIATRVISLVQGDLLYARVDLMSDDRGELLVSELELMEPSLFLMQHPPALQRFVEAIAAWASEGRE